MAFPDSSLDFQTWYNLLEKPSWTPSTEVIGIIWGVLYPLMALVFGYALYRIFQKKQAWPKSLLLPILLNVFFNAIFTPVQFGLRNFPLACVVVVLVFGTALWSMIVLYRHHKKLAIALLPYVGWTGIASVLQIQITLLNL